MALRFFFDFGYPPKRSPGHGNWHDLEPHIFTIYGPSPTPQEEGQEGNVKHYLYHEVQAISFGDHQKILVSNMPYTFYPPSSLCLA